MAAADRGLPGLVCQPISDHARPQPAAVADGGRAGPGRRPGGVLLVLHHVVSDGLRGVALLTALLEDTPDAPSLVGPPWQPQASPTTAGLVKDNLGRRLSALRRAVCGRRSLRSYDACPGEGTWPASTRDDSHRSYRSDPSDAAAELLDGRAARRWTPPPLHPMRESGDRLGMSCRSDGHPGVEQGAATADHQLTSGRIQNPKLPAAVSCHRQALRTELERHGCVLWIDGASTARAAARRRRCITRRSVPPVMPSPRAGATTDVRAERPDPAATTGLPVT